MEYPNGIDIAAWKYLAVVVPIIVFFAPLGSLLSSYFHRQVLAALVYGLDTVALVSSYKSCLCPFVRYFCTLFWDDITTIC